MTERLQRGLYALENHPVLSSIRQGFILVIPVLITGSLALLVRSFPIPQVQEFLQTFLNGFLDRALLGLFNATSGLMSVYITLAISYFYSQTLAREFQGMQAVAMFTALACFVLSFCVADGALTTDYMGSNGVFVAMVCAILATRLFYFLCRLFFRRRGAASQDGGSTGIGYQGAIRAIAPFLLCALVFGATNLGVLALFQARNLNDLISRGLTALFQSVRGELAEGVLFVLALNFFWFFGIHGGNVLDQAAKLLLVPANTDPAVIVSKSFLDTFSLMGGSGTAICLLLALLLLGRRNRGGQLARSAAPLVLFNINEILVFGLPVVLDPLLFLPFLLVPLASLLISYGATVLGFLPVVNTTVTWTTPVFWSGYLATSSWAGVAVQAVTICVGTLIYLPFLRLSQRLRRSREPFLLSRLTALFQQDEAANVRKNYLGRHDSVGNLAKAAAQALERDLEEKKLRLHYQSQVDAQGRVVGAEALLRWNFSGEPVYPPLAVRLAQEAGIYDRMTFFLLDQACRALPRFMEHTPPQFHLSVNISAEQLADEAFVHQAEALVLRNGAQGHIVLEVTEETALTQFENTAGHMAFLRDHGVELAVDDFSMGQTSINYLRDNRFRYVKLDGTLVRQVGKNARCREIISSIVGLGDRLGFQVVAEYVENEEIRDTLLKLGCRHFQGYLYSPALPPEEFLAYCAGRAEE